MHGDITGNRSADVQCIAIFYLTLFFPQLKFLAVNE